MNLNWNRGPCLFWESVPSPVQRQIHTLCILQFLFTHPGGASANVYDSTTCFAVAVEQQQPQRFLNRDACRCWIVIVVNMLITLWASYTSPSAGDVHLLILPVHCRVIRVDGLVSPTGGLDWYDGAIAKPVEVLTDMVGALAAPSSKVTPRDAS
jgi:hypothetical protein